MKEQPFVWSVLLKRGSKMIYSLFIGRWQPFHDGHKALIDLVLAEGKNVCIAVRDTELSEDNPLDNNTRRAIIRRWFPDSNKVIPLS